jgi:hypothetical protein
VPCSCEIDGITYRFTRERKERCWLEAPTRTVAIAHLPQPLRVFLFYAVIMTQTVEGGWALWI